MVKKQRKSKLKTHKATASRIHVSGNGKLLRLHAHRSHFRRRKSKAVRRLFGQKESVAAVDAPRVRRLLPYARRRKVVRRVFGQKESVAASDAPRVLPSAV